MKTKTKHLKTPSLTQFKGIHEFFNYGDILRHISISPQNYEHTGRLCADS